MKTTIRISKEINTELLIASRLVAKCSKEDLAEKILSEGLKLYTKDLQRMKFV